MNKNIIKIVLGMFIIFTVVTSLFAGDGNDKEENKEKEEEKNRVVIQNFEDFKIGEKGFVVGCEHGKGNAKCTVSEEQTHSGKKSIKLEYDAPKDSDNIFTMSCGIGISGMPIRTGFWVYNDNEEMQIAFIAIRYTDSTGEWFQQNSKAIDFKGWEYLEFKIEGGAMGAGNNDGVVDYPITLCNIYLWGVKGKGTIYLDDISIVEE